MKPNKGFKQLNIYLPREGFKPCYKVDRPGLPLPPEQCSSEKEEGGERGLPGE